MISVRLRQSRLCDVPVGLMSETDAAKFDDLVADWLPYRGRVLRKLDTQMDLSEFRKGLTPCELEILEYRYAGLSFEQVSEMLRLPTESVKAVLKDIFRRAARLEIPNLEMTMFERELIGVRENKQPNRRIKCARERIVQVFESVEKREARLLR